MSKFNSLSRRESLFGIGAAGTLLGGGALGISSAMAGDESDDEHDEEYDGEKKAGFALTLVCHEKGKAKFDVHNETDKAAKVNWSVAGDATGDGTDADDAEAGEDFDPDGETIEDGEEVDDDNGDDDAYDNGGPNGTEPEAGLEGKLTVPKKGSETFWVDVVSKDATVAIYHDGKKVDAADVEKAACEKYSPAEKIDLEAVCYRTRKATEDENGSDANGDDADDAEAGEDFDPDGETIEDGEEVDDDGDDDNDDDNGHDDDGHDNGEPDDDDADGDKQTVREAKFRVSNENKQEVKVNWTVDADGQGGKCYIEGKAEDTFWVMAPEGRKTYVTITYDGEEVATEKADTTTTCPTDC